MCASPNMMHFVRTFSVMCAQGVRLIAIEEVRNYGKIVLPTLKTFSKMAGGECIPLILPPWIRPGYKLENRDVPQGKLLGLAE